jgi:hypothetical protein
MKPIAKITPITFPILATIYFLQILIDPPWESLTSCLSNPSLQKSHVSGEATQAKQFLT